MPHLWVQLEDGGWGTTELDGRPIVVDGKARCGVRASLPGEPTETDAVLYPGPDGRSWALLCGGASDARVNGQRVALGLRVLRDKDEIAAGPACLFYSTERLCRVEPFPGQDAQVRCGRCQQPLAKGTPAVRCPNCDTWYHQADDLPCWTYTPTCSVCRWPTEMADAYQWHPEDAPR